MKLLALIKKYAFYIILFLFTIVLFYPLFTKGQIPFSSNLLSSYFNPFAQEKFSGWEQGIPNKPIGIDDIRIFYPQRKFTMQQLSLGNLPFWNPYTFSGSFHIGLSESAVFYPLNILFFLLPQIVSWTILFFVQPIIAGIGMYLFLKVLVKNKKSAIFGGLVFGFSGIVIVRMVEALSVGHTLIWLPFVFWGIESFLQEKKIRYIFISTFALVFSLLAGWFQFTFYICIFSFVYSLFRLLFSKVRKNLSSYLTLLPFFLLPLLTGFHLLPAIQAFVMSPRGQFSQNLLFLHLMPLAHGLSLIYPDLWGNPGSYNFFGISEYKESVVYIGIIPFIISIFSIFLIKSKDKKIVIFFIISSIFTLLMGLDNPLSRTLLKLPVPIVSSFLPDRIFLLTTFSLIVLSAFGLKYLISVKPKLWQYIIVFLPFLAVLILTPIGSFKYHWHRIQAPANYTDGQTWVHIKIDTFFLVQEKNLILPSIFVLSFFILLFIYFKFRKQRTLFILILLFFFVGQFYFANKYIPWSQSQFVFPKNAVFDYLQKNSGINRFVSTREGYISSDIPLFYDLYTPDGVGSMYIERYGKLTTFVKNKGTSIVKVPRIEVRIDPQASDLLSGQNLHMLRFFQIDGIKYVVRLKAEKAKINKEIFQKVWENNKWEIYTYKSSLPRLFFTSDYFVEKQENELLKRVFKVSNPTQIGLEKDPGFKPEKTEGNIVISTYKPGKIVLVTNTESDGLVYISDNFVKEWEAKVDSKETQILRANYSFMAVPVKQGRHIIVLSFKENGEGLAFIIAGITFSAMIMASWYLARKNKFEF